MMGIDDRWAMRLRISLFASWLCSHLKAGYLIPELESVRTFPAILFCLEPMSTRAEVLADGPDSGQEGLGMARRLEPAHRPFTRACRLVRMLRPIVQSSMTAMFHTRRDLHLSCLVASELVRDQHTRNVLAPLQQFAKELLRCSLVPPALDEDIEHVPVLIEAVPQVVSFPVDLQEDFIQKPFVAQPSLSTWADDDHPLLLVEQTVAKTDPDPKALACFGLLLRSANDAPEQVLLRFVNGRPVSAVTTAFLGSCAERLAAQGKRVLFLVWDKAAWHVSREVRTWLRAHNRQAKRDGTGVRIIACAQPVKSARLNAIEPTGTHTKKRIIEPDRLLPARELADRFCKALACSHEPHLTMPKNVA